MALLTDTAIKAAKPRQKPYKLKDERGLYLLVQPTGGRLWRLRFYTAGRESMVSLGAWPDVPLKLARERREEARQLIARGENPSTQRKADRDARADTFKAVALEWLEKQQHKMSESSYAKSKWLLEDLLFPFIGAKPIADIDAPDLLAALRRTEARGRHESAHRAKWKAGQVFRYAIATGRARHNPAGDLREALAPVKTKHFAAITDPVRIGELLRALEAYSGQPATEYALKLAPLLFVRPGELRGARWEEFTLDGEEPVWRIPAERMKMRDEHLVPLSRQAVALLDALKPITGPDGLVFPSLRSRARPISENTINGALRRLGYSKEEMTGHGFRAMASTCLNERGYSPEVIELQLAHVERNKVRAAYARGKALPARRKMMQEWADYLDGLRAGTNIVPIKRKA
jgi:integrase